MKLTIDIPEDMLNSEILDAIVYVDTERKEIKKVHIEPRIDQELCDDTIRRSNAIKVVDDMLLGELDCKEEALKKMKRLPPVTPAEKVGRCKDCKWWKDSDGTYRRGIGTESQCPINRREVFDGNGYCYLFEPQESEVQDADSN